MNRTRKTIASAALLGTIAAGGAAGLLSSGSTANAATDTSVTDSSVVAAASTATAATAATPATPATPAATGTAAAPPDGTKADGTKADGTKAGPHQANGITETLLTGDDLAKATAAASTAAPGSTVVRAETDADGDVFEVHITQADGSKATVKLNADFSVKTVEVGNGK